MNIRLDSNTRLVGRRPTKESYKVILRDGQYTTLHVVRYRHDSVRPRVVQFQKGTRLLEWCRENGVYSAVSGGFHLRKTREPLGDSWVNGVRQQTVPFIKPWDNVRGTLYINDKGRLQIAPRYIFPQEPKTDLLQVGPILAVNGKSVADVEDIEGCRSGHVQFDDDWTQERFPRAAICTDDDYIYTVASNGYMPGESGMTFIEFADALLKLGAKDVLNLDGGSSATLIFDGKLLNWPHGGKNDNYQLFPKGRPVYSAIVFDPI